MQRQVAQKCSLYLIRESLPSRRSLQATLTSLMSQSVSTVNILVRSSRNRAPTLPQSALQEHMNTVRHPTCRQRLGLTSLARPPCCPLWLPDACHTQDLIYSWSYAVVLPHQITMNGQQASKSSPNALEAQAPCWSRQVERVGLRQSCSQHTYPRCTQPTQRSGQKLITHQELDMSGGRFNRPLVCVPS